MINYRNKSNKDDVVIEIDETYNSKKKKKNFRKRLFEIVEVGKNGDYISLFYDISIIIAVLVSLIPLAFKESYPLFSYTEIIVTTIFIIDYIFRYITADYKLNDKSIMSFIKYPFTLRAIVDLLSILPSVTIIYDQFKLLRIFTLIKTLKIIRIFKTFRYSKSISIISNVIKKSKQPLIAVGTLSVGYVLVSALIIFNVEEQSFDNFFSAVYWATVSLTTVGYGDIYPTTTEGRIISMISSVFGIAVVALPAGIITAGYMDSLSRILEEDSNSTKHSSITIESCESNCQSSIRGQDENDITHYRNI